MPARDTVNSIKQAHEFGIVQRGSKLAALLMFIDDVHALGLETAQGLILTESFYWDLNDRTRAFTKKIAAATAEQSGRTWSCRRLRRHAALPEGGDMGWPRRSDGSEVVDR